MVKHNRLPHALMFTGPEGVGSLPTAFAFAQYVLCINKTENDSCGVCLSCVKTSKLIHPDVHIVFPIAKSKSVSASADLIKDFRETFLELPYLTLNDWFNSFDAENKQPVITVDDAKDIIKQLSYTSFEGGYKIVLIWQPEKMNLATANKLLKILEEPSEKTIFLLVCNNPHEIIPTIASRVQQILFSKLSPGEIASALTMQYQCSAEAAQQAAFLADGSYREAEILLLQMEGGTAHLQNFRAFMLVALNFDPIKAIAWIDENARSGREKHKQFLQYCLEIFRDCLMFNFGSRDLIKLSGNENDFIQKFSRFINQHNYEQLTETFNSSYYNIIRNANPKILFMHLIMETNTMLNKKA